MMNKCENAIKQIHNASIRARQSWPRSSGDGGRLPTDDTGEMGDTGSSNSSSRGLWTGDGAIGDGATGDGASSCCSYAGGAGKNSSSSGVDGAPECRLDILSSDC